VTAHTGSRTRPSNELVQRQFLDIAKVFHLSYVPLRPGPMRRTSTKQPRRPNRRSTDTISPRASRSFRHSPTQCPLTPKSRPISLFARVGTSGERSASSTAPRTDLLASAVTITAASDIVDQHVMTVHHAPVCSNLDFRNARK
jgi:hypothetical protein